MIMDNFLKTFSQLREHAVQADYSGVTNPADGVLYPDITADIPVEVLEDVQSSLDKFMGWQVGINTIFMRLTSKNTKGAPHQAHTDAIMGDFTLLLYLQDGPGGTSFVRHKTIGLHSQPANDAEAEIWRRDTNIPDAWEITEMVAMKSNRANIVPSYKMHRAEPVGGFGEGPEDGRIVLTAFFS